MPRKPKCIHYWVLPPPNGPTCEGVCKKCGAVREHRNSIQWNGWRGSMRRNKAGKHAGGTPTQRRK